MKYGFVLPRGDAQTAAEFAHIAEESGWDGFFVWEATWGWDAWMLLTAAAMRTAHIRLGTMLSPLSRMRPWKLASESLTLDHLSHGRVTLAVGLGAPETGFTAFGEVTERKARAELLDEGLELLELLWKGQPFQYQGKHYQVNVNSNTFGLPFPQPSLQQPHIPIWVVGAWPSLRSMRRALRYDGLLPAVLDDNRKVRMGTPTPQELNAICQYARANRAPGSPYDIIIEGTTPGDDPDAARSLLAPYQQAGVTWWIEAMWETQDMQKVSARLRQGPPPQE